MGEGGVALGTGLNPVHVRHSHSHSCAYSHPSNNNMYPFVGTLARVAICKVLDI